MKNNIKSILYNLNKLYNKKIYRQEDDEYNQNYGCFRTEYGQYNEYYVVFRLNNLEKFKGFNFILKDGSKMEIENKMFPYNENDKFLLLYKNIKNLSKIKENGIVFYNFDNNKKGFDYFEFKFFYKNIFIKEGKIYFNNRCLLKVKDLLNTIILYKKGNIYIYSHKQFLHDSFYN